MKAINCTFIESSVEDNRGTSSAIGEPSDERVHGRADNEGSLHQLEVELSSADADHVSGEDDQDDMETDPTPLFADI